MKQEISELNGKLREEKKINLVFEDRIGQLLEQKRADTETKNELRERINHLEQKFVQTRGSFYKAKKEHLPYLKV